MKTMFVGKMSTFGGPADTGVAADEGLALIELSDLGQWWFAYLFGISTFDQVIRKEIGLARALNPNAFYCAARWDYNEVDRETLRHSFVRIVSAKSPRAIFARPVDWGPNQRTKRVLDISPGAAKALNVTTDDSIRGDLILPILN